MPAVSVKQLLCLKTALEDSNRAIASKLEMLLLFLEGEQFKSEKACKKFVKTVQMLLSRLNYLIRCPKCGKPSITFYFYRGPLNFRAFAFQHRVGGRKITHYFGGLCRMPKLKLVPAMSYRRREKLLLRSNAGTR